MKNTYCFCNRDQVAGCVGLKLIVHSLQLKYKLNLGSPYPEDIQLCKRFAELGWFYTRAPCLGVSKNSSLEVKGCPLTTPNRGPGR